MIAKFWRRKKKPTEDVWGDGLMFPEVVKAYNFAAKAHEGQVDDNGNPYINHPEQVYGIIAEVVKLEETRRAAGFYLWYGEPELGDELAALLAGED